jgi:hypothetical protein
VARGDRPASRELARTRRLWLASSRASARFAYAISRPSQGTAQNPSRGERGLAVRERLSGERTSGGPQRGERSLAIATRSSACSERRCGGRPSRRTSRDRAAASAACRARGGDPRR